MELRDFDVDHFLRHYWQKRPLLIRNAWTDWENPLSPDELAGLACESGIESRLVTRSGTDWALEHGPFAEERFATLEESHWTLLIQAVDQIVPEVAAMIAPFRFIPDWRIDDVMISYAADQGGVGAHYDQYDVFLIQGLGRRRWQTGPMCDGDSPLLPHDDLRLLADFEPVDDWVLEPGDILYLPPRLAHNGVAVGEDCMTYSVGFRAPSHSELLAHFCDHLLADMPDDDRYADPDLERQPNPGEIAPAALDRLQAMALERMQDRAVFARWFGRYNSAPKYPDAICPPDDPIAPDEVARRLVAGETLERNPASRFSFVRQSGGTGLLFADGQAFDCDAALMPFAEALCAAAAPLPASTAGADRPDAAATHTLIAALHDQGSLLFPADFADADDPDDGD